MKKYIEFINESEDSLKRIAIKQLKTILSITINKKAQQFVGLFTYLTSSEETSSTISSVPS
jgi:hypothetical protein